VDFLKSVAGMFTSSVLRLAVAVGILAATYLFIVRPVLDTTNNAIDSANGFNQSLNANIAQSVHQSDVNPNVARQVRLSIRRANHQVKRALNRSLNQTAPTQARQRRLLHCVQRSHGNVARMQRCTQRF
jgi:predicted PurR-regulated permease PerM